jgi:hypothetical protein
VLKKNKKAKKLVFSYINQSLKCIFGLKGNSNAHNTLRIVLGLSGEELVARDLNKITVRQLHKRLESDREEMRSILDLKIEEYTASLLEKSRENLRPGHYSSIWWKTSFKSLHTGV